MCSHERKRKIKNSLFSICRYYLATLNGDPAQQHLYRVSLLDSNLKSECLSCNVKSDSDGVRCLYNLAKFSPGNSHYVLTCAGPGVPDISIYDKVSPHRSLAYIMRKSFESEVRLIRKEQKERKRDVPWLQGWDRISISYRLVEKNEISSSIMPMTPSFPPPTHCFPMCFKISPISPCLIIWFYP